MKTSSSDRLSRLMGSRAAPDGVERVADAGGHERRGEAACEGRHALRQQVECRQLQRHVRRDP